MTAGRPVLVVAADPERRAALGRALKGLGPVGTVGTLDEALAEIRREPPRVCVLRADLPGDGVLAVARALVEPRGVLALVPAAGDVGVKLAESGVCSVWPDSTPDSTVRTIAEHLSRRAASDHAEKLRRVLAAVSHARHEVNNPLTAILAEAQLLLLDAAALPAEAQRSLRTIEEMAGRIRDVMRELHSLREGA